MFRPTSRLIARPSAFRSLSRASPTRRFISTAPPSQKSRSWKSAAARWGLAAGAVYYYNTSSVFAEEPAYTVVEPIPVEKEGEQGLGELEEEADQQGAFNPETGEINWDCPCLGGMADGPCGEQFKAAFSCFVFSTDEPKGMDCIDKFKGMQDCFRAHPDIYGAELEEEESEAGLDVASPDDATPPTSENPESDTEAVPQAHIESSLTDEVLAKRDEIKAAADKVKKEEPVSEANELVPRAWHDTQSDNEEKKS
ncbi:hypothetical protein BU16DRAFT_521112 [Lophium mytilinum]|uniref:Mitochondrial intermembrane space import and assembly protein 40 n=1 Tax=Lophium mytilinum TaxID=390894 RepID=A0A6A6RD36_9PEZI|nr:hypothetical protein BU16DRAFT_521112 [Lophium mytilinum]